MIKALMIFTVFLSAELSFADGQKVLSLKDYDFGSEYTYSFADLGEDVGFSQKDLDSILWDTGTILSVLVADRVLDQDKAKHYLVGALVGRIASAYCDRKDFNLKLNKKKLNYLCSFGAAALAGVLKEVYDSTGRGQVDANDALATAAGGAFVGLRFAF